MDEVEVDVGGLVRTVKLWHLKFARGGFWPFFICPNCARRCKTLRQYDGKLMCSNCDGLLQRGMTTSGDKGPRIARLRALLATKQATVKPRASHNRVLRRKAVERALRRALIVERQKRLEKWTKARELAKRSTKRSSKPNSSNQAAT